MPVSRVINPPAPNAAGDKSKYKLTRVRFNNTTTFVYQKIDEKKDTKTKKIVKPPLPQPPPPPPPPVKEIPPKKFDPPPPPPSPSPPPSSPEPELEYESEPEVTETESDIQSETTSEYSEPPTNNNDNSTPLPVNHMEEIVLEKLKLVNADPEENRDKVRELWDDIQILAFLEEETELSKAPKAVSALQKHIGDQKTSKLTHIISRIAKKEIQPKTKVVKMPPSWIDQGKDNKEFGGFSGAKLHIFFDV